VNRRLSVSLTAAGLADYDLVPCVLVAIDILRASTSIVQALANGAHAVYPVSDPFEARELTRLLPDLLLAGERQGQKLEGFDLGNSPREFTREKVQGRPIALSTTNGTAVTRAGVEAASAVVGCFLNMSRVVAHLCREGEERPVHLACAGTGGGTRVCLEDALFAGRLIEALIERSGGVGGEQAWALEQEAALVRGYAQSRPGAIERILPEFPHVSYLNSLGYTGDADWAARQDSVPVLPMVKVLDGRPAIVPAGDEDR